MSKRLLTGLAAAALLAGPALAEEKKKAPITPETGPAPLVVPPLSTIEYQVPLLPPPRPVEPAVITPRPAIGLRLPPPAYLPPEPHLPPLQELSYQEEAAGLLAAVKATPKATVVKTYSVGDLVVPLPKAGQSPNAVGKTTELDLIRSICRAVEPKSWKDAGGTGTMEYFPLGMALVVNAAPGVHAALEKYLDGVRQMNDLQITLEISVLTISQAGLEKSGLAADFLPAGDKAGSIRTRMKFLSADQLAALRLDRDEIKDQTCPRLSILNGQEGRITIGQAKYFLTGVTVQSVNNAIVMVPRNEPHETGVEVKVEGTVSADKRFVQLAVNAKSRELAVEPVAQIPVTVPVPAKCEAGGKCGEKAPFTQFIEDPKFVTRSVAETVTVPDGGTVVFYGGKADFERTVREKVPMLADVPVLAELFSKDKKEASSDHLLIVATPRVVNPHAGTEESEVRTDGKLAKLMAEYARACKDGKSADALKLAVECLSLDPTCFGKK